MVHTVWIWILGGALLLPPLLLYSAAVTVFFCVLGARRGKKDGNPPHVREMLEGYAAFFDEAKREEITVTAPDGTRLCAHLIEGEDRGKFAILCHGYTMQARGIAGPASKFYEMGYSLLLPDARAHGKSGGRFIGMGWAERWDLIGWVEYLNQRYGAPRVVLYGISMGGATVMMATGEALPPNVKAAVEDCGYTSVWEEFAHQMKNGFHIPPFPMLHLVDRIARHRVGYSLRDASAIRQVAKSKTPTLFIHGEEDTFVPFAFLRRIFDAASCEKEMLPVPGAPHGLSAPTNPDLYWSKVSEFLGKHV